MISNSDTNAYKQNLSSSLPCQSPAATIDSVLLVDFLRSLASGTLNASERSINLTINNYMSVWSVIRNAFQAISAFSDKPVPVLEAGMDQTGIDLDVGLQPMLLAQILSISRLGRLAFKATLQTGTLTILNEGVVTARSNSSWSVQQNGQLSLFMTRQHHGTLRMPWMPWLQKQYTQPTVNTVYHTTHCRYTDYSIIFTESRSACSTFPVLPWFGPPHTHTWLEP